MSKSKSKQFGAEAQLDPNSEIKSKNMFVFAVVLPFSIAAIIMTLIMTPILSVSFLVTEVPGDNLNALFLDKNKYARISTPPQVKQLNYCGDHKVIALTFDDGPFAAHSPKVIDELNSVGVKGSFYITPKNGGTLNDPADQSKCDTVRYMLSQGHSIQ
eukprot:Pgem_evm1s8411